MSFDPTDKIAPFPPRATDVEPGFERFEPLLTVDVLKDDYLFGIPLKSALTNQEIGKETLKRYIVRAISSIEHELRINISPVKYTERYDYNLWDYQKYNFLQLNHWPVLQIESFKGKFPNATDFLQYPNEWISLYNETGIFQLVPTNGQITQFFLSNAGYMPLLLGARAQHPQLWEVVYTAGFDHDKIPALINDLIGIRASLDALTALGPIIFPYGSYSVSIDGTGQGVGTPGPQYLMSRVQELQERYMKQLDVAKRHYSQSLNISVL